MDSLATFEPIRHRAAVNGDEEDAFNRFSRGLYLSFKRPGVAHKTKARASRRARHAVRQTLRGSRYALVVQRQAENEEWFLSTATF